MQGWLLSPDRYEQVDRALVELNLPSLDDAPCGEIGAHRLVPDETVHDLLERAEQVLGPDALVTRLLDATETSPRGALELAMLASDTVQDALERACRYDAYWVTSCDLVLVETDGGGMLTAHARSKARRGRDIAVACLLAAITRHVRQGAALQIAVSQVDLVWTPAQPVARLHTAFGANPAYGSGLDALHFATDDLHAPLSHAFPPFAEFFDGTIDDVVSSVANTDQSWSARTGQALLPLMPGGDLSIEAVARRLGVSPRTLQRRLEEESTSFRALVEDLRRHLAQAALRRPDLSVAEVGYTLGFDHPGSFIRAFREWTGQTPGRWRQAQA